MFFKYGKTETDCLKQRCPRLAHVIEHVGPIKRRVDRDLFSAVVHHIVGQQISTKAQATIWDRFEKGLLHVTPQTVVQAGLARVQGFGISFKKAENILDFAQKIQNNAFDLDALWHLPDAEVAQRLSSLKGVGVWTAEMLLLFCMERPDIFSYDDLALQRGLRMLYHHRKITRPLFEKYRKRFSPYGSVASLYLWAVAGGAVPGLKDYAPAKKAPKPAKRK